MARDWPDLRLAGVACATWLSALFGLYVDWPVSAAVAGGAGVGVVVGGWWLARARQAVPGRDRGAAAATSRGAAASLSRGIAAACRWAVPSRVGWVGLTLLVGVLAGAGATSARVAVRDAEPLSGLAHQRATVCVALEVDDDPRPVRATAGRQAEVAVAVSLRGLCDPVSVRVSARLLVLAPDPAWRTLLPGQQLTASGRLGAARGGDLRAAILSATGPPTAVQPAPWVQRAAGTLRTGLQRACAPLPSDRGGLLPGLVVGDTSRLDPAVADDFRTTGMTHLVAVSGANLAIVAGLVLGLLRWCRAGPRLAAAVCVVALVGFVILVRPSPSVLRAAAMGGLGLVALAVGRPASAVPGLAAAVTVLVLVDPELAGDAGFALSVLATAGLLLLAPRWRDALRHRGVPGAVAEAVAVPAAAQAACAPVIAAISGTVGLTAVPANLLAAPAVAPATVLGVVAAVLSPVWPAAAGLVAWLAGWPAQWLVLVARYGARVPAGVVPWPGGATGGLLLGTVVAVLLVGARHRTVRRIALVVTLGGVLGAVPVNLVAGGWPPAGWLIVVCDVGQGDAVVLPAGPGQAVVVDAGPAPTATDRCLSRLGVTRVPLFVVSHFHADHVGGVDGVFRGRAVGAVLTTGYDEPAFGHVQVLDEARTHGVPVRVPAVGAAYDVGAVHLAVLGPGRTLSGTRSDPNNNSLVVRATVRGHVLLLAGDAETEEQGAVLGDEGGGALRAEILKVPHHGSAYQDEAFLDTVAPAVGLVSVGAGNAYGHPNPAVLSRLARGGTRVLRTDLDGDLAAVDRGGGLAVVVRGLDAGRHPP